MTERYLQVERSNILVPGIHAWCLPNYPTARMPELANVHGGASLPWHGAVKLSSRRGAAPGGGYGSIPQSAISQRKVLPGPVTPNDSHIDLT